MSPASVLFVDDDLLLLRSLRRVMSDRFTITSACSAGDASGLLRAGHRFDAIVSDMWMLGQCGQQLFEEVIAIAPEQAEQMIFLTGGGLPTRMESFLVGKVLVRKPFDVGHLAAVIQRVADGRSPTFSLRPRKPSTASAAHGH